MGGKNQRVYWKGTEKEYCSVLWKERQSQKAEWMVQKKENHLAQSKAWMIRKELEFEEETQCLRTHLSVGHKQTMVPRMEVMTQKVKH
jgi:hypothetical protein